MATLVSPGVEVTIIDQSQYLPAASSSVPFIMVATAQDKVDPNSTTGAVAAGTTAANAGKLYQVTSQRDLVSLFGNPFFYKTTAGTSIQGYELNEYGLLAAYSTLGVTNRAFVMRADIDLASLIGQIGRPLGDPANGTYWLDTTNSKWGIFEFDAVTNRFVNKVPIVVTETNQIDVSTGAPLTSVGVIGDYAINQTSLYHSLSSREYPGAWYKNMDNEWVQVGSLAWRNSWPTVRGTTPQTVIGGNIGINVNGAQFTIQVIQGSSVSDVVQQMNELIPPVNNSSTPQVFRAAFTNTVSPQQDIALSRIDLYTAQSIDESTITLSGSSATWASLGFVVPETQILVGQGVTYYQPTALWASNANQPRWRSTDQRPRPTGSVYFKTTAANDGASLVVSQYSSTADTWTSTQAPYYGNDAAAINALDTQGGQNIPAGALYTNYAFDGTLEQYGIQLFRRVASGPANYTGLNASTISFTPGETVSISYTVPGIGAYSDFVDVTINGTGYANFQAALSAATANAPYIVSSTDTNGNIVLQHTRGGTIRMTDALSRGVTSATIATGGGIYASLGSSNTATVTGQKYDFTANGAATTNANIQVTLTGTVVDTIITNQASISIPTFASNAVTATANLTVTGNLVSGGQAAQATGTFINTGDTMTPVWSISSISVNGGNGYTGNVTFSINGTNVAQAQLNYSVTSAAVTAAGTGYITANSITDTGTWGSLVGNAQFSAVASTISGNVLGITSYSIGTTAKIPQSITANVPVTLNGVSGNITATITGSFISGGSATAASNVITVPCADTNNVFVGTVATSGNLLPLGSWISDVTTDSSVDITVPSDFTTTAGLIADRLTSGTIISVFGYRTDNSLIVAASPTSGSASITAGYSNATVNPVVSNPQTNDTGGVVGRLGFTPTQNSAAKDSSILLVNYSNISGMSSVGSGAAFNVVALDTYYEVEVSASGSSYQLGTIITFDAASVGAESTDQLRVQVTSVGTGGDITSVIVLTGTPIQQKSYELSNWYRLGYVANEGQPSVNPANNTPWFYSVIDEVDIMINDADPDSPANWKGYRNVAMDVRGYDLTQTDPNGPIVSASSPTTQSDGTALVYGDLWIDTSDLENYPQIYRWENVEAVDQWVLINNADQATQNGIVFADARWGAAGTVDPVNDPIPTIQSLLVSNYLDLDAPSAAVYPQGMLLWNTRRSGYNIKEFRTNYFNSQSFPDQVLPQYTYTWVSTSGLRSDGSPYMGRKAQRAQVVAAMRSAIDTNMTVREEDTFFNLIAAPNYPELQPNMVALNNERMNTAYIIGDTPLRLRDDANDIVAWATNADNATSTGEDGLVTRDAYMGLYYPAGITTDLTGAEVVVPASHMMLRTMLRNDTIAYPWFAPAGTRRGTIDNANNIGYLDAQSGEFQIIKNRMRIRDVLYENQINPLAFFTGVGLVNYGNKNSQDTFSALNRTNVARLVAFIRERLNVAAKPFVFEFNDSLTRAEIRNVCQTLLADILSKRGLYDYLVVCDTTNNTPARIDRNELWVDIAIEPAKAAEFIYIPVRILNTGEIAGLGQNG